MPEKFQNKYRIAPNRLQNWDYGWDGKYFITICTKNRDHFFGEILPSHKEIELSETGRISQEIWNKIPIHFPYVILDEFVVMPNHIHGILIIDKQ
ncbi:MAG TPA: transposase, partial [Salinimicrobium sp.]|nr:transposase [Salinimicrobium sp.]